MHSNVIDQVTSTVDLEVDEFDYIRPLEEKKSIRSPPHSWSSCVLLEPEKKNEIASEMHSNRLIEERSAVCIDDSQ